MKILVVDDSRSIRKGLRQQLETNGFEIQEAVDGLDALGKIKEFKPDLVTMDIDMPVMDGFKATAAIRETEFGKELPIIFLTSHDSLKEREHGFYLGAVEFISKSSPAPWQEVVMAVNRMLRCQALPENFTVLVVEDNDVTRRILVNIFSQNGLQVLEAINGREGLALAEKNRADIDLVITDYMMPEMNGGELCLKLRNNLGFRHTPIIFLSGVNEKSWILEMFRTGATDYIMKPFVKEELLARIKVHMEQWQLVKELNSTVAELEKMNKLRDEFVGMATHDLKNPLNGIMGFSHLMKQDGSLPQKHHKMLETIHTSSVLMLDIVNDILALSKLDAHDDDPVSEPLQLLSVINTAVAGIQQTAFKKGVVLEVENLCSCDAVIDGNRHAFLRILNNLLSNAIKFTPANGKVRLVLGMVAGKEVYVSVADTGIGIPESMVDKLFDRFTKSARNGTDGEAGTGLGLAITKRLVEKLAGSIEVISKEGEGSSFRLTFPFSSKA
ncbi:MAG: response regulator [Desulfobulbaceae bacterium]|nr:response regulator [Desulfobulbaceae bacterium]HIJ78102.1 response regulator [Deltaproteobacteria bacterium]